VLIATMVVRDEIDILPYTLDAFEAQGVRVLAIDNGSTDGSREYLAGRGVVARVWDEPGDPFPQAEWMTFLAEEAYMLGATWVVSADSDELWYGLRWLSRVPPEYRAVAVPLYNHLPSAGEAFEIEKSPRCGGRITAKVAHRGAPGVRVGTGNHSTSAEPTLDWAEYTRTLTEAGHGEMIEPPQIEHYPIRSWRQFEKKVRRLAEILAHMPADPAVAWHWRGYVAEMERGRLKALYDQMAKRGLFLLPRTLMPCQVHFEE
jgi:hypothetical protein